MSTIKVANIQHPDASEPTIVLSANGSLSLPAFGVDDLSDVNTDNPQDGQALVYDDGDWVNQSVVIAVEHGSNASVARPNAVVVYWKGSVSPDNAIDGDVWYDTSS